MLPYMLDGILFSHMSIQLDSCGLIFLHSMTCVQCVDKIRKVELVMQTCMSTQGCASIFPYQFTCTEHFRFLYASECVYSGKI